MINNAISYFEQKLQFEAEMGLVRKIADGEENGYFMLDVRNAEAFQKGHIPTATNIPRNELANRLTELPKDKTIITYCYHAYCFASAKAALELAKNGFKVMEMPGGFDEWEKREHPVHKHGNSNGIVCDC
jgi:rhodanese-related sulfurtransferase